MNSTNRIIILDIGAPRPGWARRPCHPAGLLAFRIVDPGEPSPEFLSALLNCPRLVLDPTAPAEDPPAATKTKRSIRPLRTDSGFPNCPRSLCSDRTHGVPKHRLLVAQAKRPVIVHLSLPTHVKRSEKIRPRRGTRQRRRPVSAMRRAWPWPGARSRGACSP